VAREIKIKQLISAYRRDSRRPPSDKATNSDEQRGFPDTEVVNHSRDYTSLFITGYGRCREGCAKKLLEVECKISRFCYQSRETLDSAPLKKVGAYNEILTVAC